MNIKSCKHTENGKKLGPSLPTLLKGESRMDVIRADQGRSTHLRREIVAPRSREFANDGREKRSSEEVN